jgi:hypothetical protein
MIPEALVRRSQLIGQCQVNGAMAWVINIRESKRYNVDEKKGECSFY